MKCWEYFKLHACTFKPHELWKIEEVEKSEDSTQYIV